MDNSSRPDYKGSGVLFFKNVFLYILAMAPLLSFCLMGEKWLRIFLIMFIPAVPLTLLVGILVSRFDSFSFDDGHQQIVKPVGRGIPYQSVMRIDINETGRLLQVSIKQGTLRRALLAYALDGKDKPRLIADMLKRFPQSAMRERQYVDWKSIFIIMAVVVLMTAIFHIVQYRNNAWIGIVPQKADWEGARGPEKGASRHSVGKFVLSLPQRFALIGKDEGALLFENAATKTKIKVVSSLQGDQPTPKSRLIRHVTGTGSYFDVLDSAYSARFGVIPLMLKGIALAGLTDVRIREIRQPSNRKKNDGTMHGKDAFVNTQPPGLKGFITQGKKKETEVTYILLTDLDQRSELNIFVSGAMRLDEKDLRKIVAAVNILPVR